MNILHYQVNDGLVGGISNYIATLISHSDRERFSYYVTADNDVVVPETLGKLRQKYPGAEIVRFPSRYGLADLLVQIRQMRRVIADKKISIVHAHAARAGLLAALSVQGTGARLVYTGHGLRYTQKKGRLKRALFFLLEKLICAVASKVVFIRRHEIAVAEENKLLNGEKVVHIQSRIGWSVLDKGLPVLRGKLMPRNATIIGMAGSVIDIKNPLMFVDIAGLVIAQTQGEAVYFVWAGDGELRGEAERLVREKGLVERVLLIGQQTSVQMAQLLSEMDFLLLTSRVETFPLVVLESMAAGVVVISNDIEGLGELVEPKVSGLTFVYDDAEDAARVVLEAIHDMPMANELKERAKIRFKDNYSNPEIMSGEYEQLYEILGVA